MKLDLQISVTTLAGWLLLANPGFCEAQGNALTPSLGISIAPQGVQFEVGQRIECILEITNLSSTQIVLPSFNFLKVDMGTPYSVVPLYVREQILKLTVKRGSNSVPINPVWLSPPEHAQPYPVEQLFPGEVIRKRFPIVDLGGASFYALTNPADYTLSIALDTTGCKDGQISKGVWVSPAVTFRIVAVPVFRAKAAGESPEAYARARVTYYLTRINQQQGESIANVASALRTPGAGAALVALTASPESGLADRAKWLLGSIRQPHGLLNTVNLPGSSNEWSQWWETTGSKIPPGQFLDNYFSQIQ